MTDCDVVIVGGGLAGLTAAYTLLSRNKSLNVVILEAKNKFGGRTKGANLNTACGLKSWDIGGQWISKCQPHVYKLVGDMGLETCEQYASGKKLMQFDQKHSIIHYSSDIPPISFFSKLELLLFMWKVRRLVKQAQSKTFLSSKLASDLDLCTLEQYKQYNIWSTEARNALDACCRCMFGTDPKHMSALFFMMYIAKAGSFESLVSCEANFGAQELKIKGGAWQICQRLADKMPNDAIITNAVVKLIEQRADSEILVHCLDGQNFKCKYLILAIPPNEINASQHGFVQARSTITNILECTQQWPEELQALTLYTSTLKRLSIPFHIPNLSIKSQLVVSETTLEDGLLIFWIRGLKKLKSMALYQRRLLSPGVFSRIAYLGQLCSCST